MSALLLPKEVAERLRMSHGGVARAIREGRIPGGFKVLGEWRVDKQEFEDWLESQRPKPASKGPRQPGKVDERLAEIHELRRGRRAA